MRRMSFSLTTAQVEARTKTVTRRRVETWRTLKPGDRLTAVHKAMGLKPGEKQRVLATIEVVSVRAERLDAITREDVVREGFPGVSPKHFVEMFCREMGAKPSDPVRRIEFRYVDEAQEKLQEVRT